ncbi:MAG: hypothetical protein RL398_798 [Planctomycetota bacterium]|jgi:hypothetical protein
MAAFDRHLAAAHALLASRLGDGFAVAADPAHGLCRVQPHGEEWLSFTCTTKHLPAFHAYLNVSVRYSAAQPLLERTGVLRPDLGLRVSHTSCGMFSRRKLPRYIPWVRRCIWTLRRPPILFGSDLGRPVEHLVDAFEGVARGALLPFLQHFRSIEAARDSLARADGGTLELDRIGALVVIDAVLGDRAHLERLRASLAREPDRHRFEQCLAKIAACHPELALGG